MNKPILFYSKKDSRSINLWNKLQKENRLENFIKICTDNNNKIPSIVRSVPSIYVKGRPIITDAAIPMFLNSFNDSVASSPEVNSQSNIDNSCKSSINNFNPIEMSDRWSDSYSFIENSNKPMDYSFQFLNTTSTNTENQTDGNNNMNKKAYNNTQTVNIPQFQEPVDKSNNNNLESRLENLQKSRINFK